MQPSTRKDFGQLNATLRARGIRPQRSIDAAHRLHRTRQAARWRPRPPTLEERFRESVLAKFVPEVERRGGETSIEEASRTVPLRLQDRAGGLYLLRAEGWRQYSRRFGARSAAVAYLCGVDDAGPWAVRVPGSTTTVAGALDALTPAEADHARHAGRKVLRQGDIYVIEMSRDRTARSAAELSEHHAWDPEARVLRHEPPAGERHHAPVHVPFPAKFVRQRVLRMGRSGRWGNGD